MTVIKRASILQLLAIVTPKTASPTLVQLFTDGYKEDVYPNKIVILLRHGMNKCREISHAECHEHNQHTVKEFGSQITNH
jgi:hypothetical protein